jgi:hypothetical protein
MKRLMITTLLIGLISLVGMITVGGVRILSEGTLYAADDSFDMKDALFRLSAEFKNFDGTETFTDETVPTSPDPGEGGILAYSKEVYVPREATLYVTISTTGDTHGGAASWFSCVVDEDFCNPGAGGAAGAPEGWIALQKLPAANEGADNCDDGTGGAGDCHDNSIYYTWCTNVKKGDHTVDIRLASSETPEQGIDTTTQLIRKRISASKPTPSPMMKTTPPGMSSSSKGLSWLGILPNFQAPKSHSGPGYLGLSGVAWPSTGLWEEIQAVPPLPH